MAALNALYRQDLARLHNLFLPSVKLLRKERVGARLRRHYDPPRTPLERLEACADVAPAVLRHLRQLRDRLDPFALAEAIDRHVEQVVALATPARRPVPASGSPAPPRFDYTFRDPLRRPRRRPRRPAASVTF